MRKLATRTALAAAVLAGPVVLPSAADARPNTTRMSCQAAKALVNRRRAITLSTGRHTYDRFVTFGYRCPFGDVTRRKRVDARNTKRCYLYVCRPRLNDCRLGNCGRGF